MASVEFLERIINRLDKIDRKHLQEHVLNLIRDKKLLSVFLDSIPDGILAIDLKGRALFANRRLIQLFHLTEPVESNVPVAQLLQDPSLIELVRDHLNQHKEMFQKEIEVLIPRPMILEITLLFEKIEGTEMAILVVRNLSAHELGTRQNFQNQQLETMVGLAAGIAHEIGNPINSITIHLQLLEKEMRKLSPREGGKLEKLKDSLAAIQEETRRLDKIIRNFLAAVRRKPLHFDLCRVHDILKKTLLIMEPELKGAKIKVSAEWDERIPEFLLDSERIQQVFVNIIKNAAQAMPKGGRLNITTRMKDKLCLVSFQDTGGGISDSDLPKIFDAYYTTKEGGSGLGLMIVYQIIREHGGRIEVSSRAAVGTKFTVILPIRKEKLGLPAPVKKGIK